MRDAMAEASRAVLDGFEIRTDAQLVKYPDRFMDVKRGKAMWDKVIRLVGLLPIGCRSLGWINWASARAIQFEPLPLCRETIY
jgi:hypothetical protein